MTVVHRADTDTDSIESVVAGLVRAWNAGAARAFAGFFAEDADMVNIHGMHLRGRQAIAGIYEMLFRSVFSGSSVTVGVSSLRMLRKNVALVHGMFTVKAARNKKNSTHDVVTSLVLVHEGKHWRVASLQNTRVTAPEA